MNLLDILILCTVLFLVVKGLIRGFLREMASLTGVVLGILLANHFHPRMTEALKPHLPSTLLLPIISFAVIFLVVLVLCNTAGWGLKLLFKKAFLGWLDRGLGVCLALTKGVIIAYLVIVVLTFFLPSGTPLIARSKLAPMIIASYQSMIGILSPALYEKWKKKFVEQRKEIVESLPEKAKGNTKKDE